MRKELTVKEIINVENVDTIEQRKIRHELRRNSVKMKLNVISASVLYGYVIYGATKLPQLQLENRMGLVGASIIASVLGGLAVIRCIKFGKREIRLVKRFNKTLR